ncbi:MAG: hypothetical protein J6Y62_03935 [Clostridia bacterium]|nr:hypothetical protein [Clostridia bacterium]
MEVFTKEEIKWLGANGLQRRAEEQVDYAEGDIGNLHIEIRAFGQAVEGGRYEATAVEKVSRGWMTGRGDSLKEAMKNLADMTEARIKSFQALMKGVKEVKA